MGQTIFQKRLFTASMCFFMVLGMTIYNIILHDGYGPHILMSLRNEFIFVYVLALALDMFLVGPLAKRFVFEVVKPSTKPLTILAISSSMVICMVTLMSVFGSIMTKGLSFEAFFAYPSTWIQNFIVALPLNLCIVSPLVRGLFLVLFPDLRERRAPTP